MRRAGPAVLGQALCHPVVDAVFGVLDIAFLGRATDQLLESHALHDRLLVAGIHERPVAVVGDHQLVVGIEIAEAFGDALDGVHQPLAGLSDLPQVALFDLDCGVAEHRQRLRHSPDLVVALVARQVHLEIAAGDRFHADAEFGQAGDDVASDIEPDDEGGADEGHCDHRDQYAGGKPLGRESLEVRTRNVQFRPGYQA